MADTERDDMMAEPPRFCTNCGEPLEPGQAFCTACGTPAGAPEQKPEQKPGLESEMAADAVPAPVPEPQVAADEDFTDASEPQPARPQPEAAESEPERGADAFLEEEADPTEVGMASEPLPAPIPEPDSDATCAAVPDPLAEPTEAGAIGSEPLPSAEPGAPVPPASPSGSAPEAPARKPRSKTPLIVVITALVAVAATVGVIFLTRPQSKPSAPADQGSAGEQDASAVVVDGTKEADDRKSPERIVVKLTDKYTTSFGSVNAVTYPAFSFKTPDGWKMRRDDVNQYGEQITLENADGVAIEYLMLSGEPSDSAKTSFEDAKSVADAAFVPGAVQAEDYSSLGSFIVAKGSLKAGDGAASGICYALLPASSIEDGAQPPMVSGAPGFGYGSSISFSCRSDKELDAQTEQEVIAILASFEVDESASAAPAEADVVDNTGDTVDADQSDYILPESASRAYSESELSSMSDYELYLARNEIYARHGRRFKNEDLQSYFGSKSWYNPSVDPGDFDQSVFNEAERANIKTIKGIEKSRGSQYL